MVLTLDGNFTIGAHVRSNVCYLIFLRHLNKIESSHKSGFLSPKWSIFPYAHATRSVLQSSTTTMVVYVYNIVYREAYIQYSSTNCSHSKPFSVRVQDMFSIYINIYCTKKNR